MKNVTELRDELAKVFEGVRDKKTDPRDAAEMNNTAGKMINTLKVEIDYNMMMKNNKNIKFLEN